MARARNIKPGFFKNEDLGTADPFVSLLFAGLWTLADKAGILEDRPLRIKAELFPYRDNFEVNRYLTELVSLGLIHRYEVDGIKYIQVVNFTKHQTPHHTEKASEYPSYSDSCKLTVKSPEINGATPSDSLIPDSLIPDSLIPDSLIPDSLIPDSVAQKPARPEKGTRLPADWRLPKAWGEWAMGERPKLTAEDVRKEGENFRDYWLANANRRDGKKADWLAAWRYWIRNVKSPSSHGYQTKGERIAANNAKAGNAWLEQSSSETEIEGEVIHD